MAKAQITVSILSWLLEERLIQTLIQIPRTTSMPLNLCLHVQGEEQISPATRQKILDATSGFMIRDIFFTKGNQGAAKPRAELLKRSAVTPFIFMTDNDMIFQPGSLDRLFNFLTNSKNSSYGMVDLVHNFLKWHRTVDGTTVNCIPLDFETQDIVDVDLIGAASIMMRKEVALLPNLIDTNYHIGTWDFDMCLNVKQAGWKIATIVDEELIAINDKTYRNPRYMAGKVYNRIRLEGTKLFEQKWGFSSEYYPNSPKVVKQVQTDTIIISRAIYTKLGTDLDIGILDEERLDMMQRYFINSLKNQTDQDFTLYIIVGAKGNETVERIESLDYGDLNIKFIYTDGNLSTWKKSSKKSKNWGREIDEGCPEDIAKNCGHPTATIMARLDIDDWVTPGWITHMKTLARNIDETHFLINYQVIGQAPDGRLYRFFAPHNPGRTSPFIALVQKTEPKISPYEDVHLNMGKKFSSVYTVGPSYAFMVVHGRNRSNRIYELDSYIGDFKTEEKNNKTDKVISMTSKTRESNISITPGKDNWKARIDRSNFKQNGK